MTEKNKSVHPEGCFSLWDTPPSAWKEMQEAPAFTEEEIQRLAKSLENLSLDADPDLAAFRRMAPDHRTMNTIIGGPNSGMNLHGPIC